MTSTLPPLHHAWITTSEGTYVVSSRRSAVFELIERIYATEADREKSRAKSILRHRIFTDREPSFAERETVKVAAKRIEYSGTPPPENPLALADMPAIDSFSFEWKGRPLAPGMRIAEEEVGPLLKALLERPRVARERWATDRPISALLLDESGALVSYAWNTHARIRTRHAEWNLCEKLLADGRKIPAGSRLFVSLKPCRMCAARIWETAEDPARLTVRFVENDPGPFARDTLLDTASQSRRRYFGTRDPHFGTEIQGALVISP